jgi:hypothetical protein
MRRFQFSTEIVSELAVLAAVAGLCTLFTNLAGFPFSVDNAVAVVCLPAIAGVAMILLCLIFPGLIAPGKHATPLQFTLPIVFTSIVFVSGLLMTTEESPIVMPRVFQALAVWRLPSELLAVIVIQSIWLSIVVAKERDRPPARES